MEEKMIDENFEKTLPQYLQHDIEALQKGINDKNCTYLDCLYDELYGSINAAQWDNEITIAEAEYLRNKYLGKKIKCL